MQTFLLFSVRIVRPSWPAMVGALLLFAAHMYVLVALGGHSASTAYRLVRPVVAALAVHAMLAQIAPLPRHLHI
jgi:hypothetical protein